MQFCPECDNILDISKNKPKNVKTTSLSSTPTTVSMTNENINDNDDINDINDEDKIIEDIITKIIKGDKIIESDLEDLNMNRILKSKKYTSLDKKQKSIIQTSLTTLFDKIENLINAYYYCSNCSYHRSIKPGMNVLSRMNTNTTNTFINLEKQKNMVYTKTLGYTTNYKCINQDCITNKNKNSEREAVMYRNNGSLQIWYACKKCESTWRYVS